jgi:HAD superfamily hydrolase (TIGR01450 family)
VNESPLLGRHDAVLLDLDGTVYHGARPIPGAAEAIAHIRDTGTPVRFVTNNAAKAPGEVAEHLTALGIPAEGTEVNTSAQAAARLLARRLPADAAVLVVGTASLADEITAAGLRPVREAGPPVAAVVQGHSPDTAWADLAEACLALRDGARWVACNGDLTLPSERGELPGNGAMVAALRAATGRAPEVAGKPEPPLLRTAAESAGARNAVVVGDRLDTDIAGAVAAGIAALVVLTGVTGPAELLAAESASRPRYLAADLASLHRTTDALAIAPQSGWRVSARGGVATVESTGGTDCLELLRALCDTAWRHGTTTVRAGDDEAATALAALDIG